MKFLKSVKRNINANKEIFGISFVDALKEEMYLATKIMGIRQYIRYTTGKAIDSIDFHSC